MNKLSIAVFASFALFISCKKGNENSSGNTSRDVRYEVSGNFTGTLVASYTTAPGSTANDPVAALPWNKDITYASGVTAAVIAISGNGGSAGQQVTVVVKRGGSPVSSTAATANSSGSFTQAAPVITF
jgi:hypothetical protein